MAYPFAEKSGSDKPRVLYATGIHCSPERAAQEFMAVREAFGRRGEKRRVRGRWKLPEANQVATHVRKVSQNGRKSWALPAKDQAATHLYEPGVVYEYVGKGNGTHKKSAPQSRRYVAADDGSGTHIAIEGALVDPHRVGHAIYSASLAEVNPDDPKQVAAFAEYLAKQQRETRPGVQAVIVIQADGTDHFDPNDTTPKVHGHIIENLTLYQDMEWDGKMYAAGTHMAGDLTDIHKMRTSRDDHLKVHHQEFGLPEQRLSQSTSTPVDKLDHSDRRKAAQGLVSDHEALKRAIDAAEDDPRIVDADPQALIGVLQEIGLQTNYRVTKTGVNSGRETLTVKLPDMPRFVGAKKLGARYDWEDTVVEETAEVIPGLRSRLEMKAAGLPRPKRPEQVKALPPRPVEPPTTAEVETALSVVKQLAAMEEATLAAEAATTAPTADRPSTSAPAPVSDALSAPAPSAVLEDDPQVVGPVPEQAPEPTWDESAWLTEPPERPSETWLEAGHRGAPVDEVAAIGRMWDEWRAYEKSSAYAAHQAAAKAAATLAVEADEHPDAAPAASGADPTYAPAPVESSDQRRLAMEAWKVQPKAEETKAALLDYQRFALEHLVGGHPSAQEMARGEQMLLDIGVGPSLLKRLDGQPHDFEPEVRAILERRELLKEKRGQAFADGRAASEREDYGAAKLANAAKQRFERQWKAGEYAVTTKPERRLAIELAQEIVVEEQVQQVVDSHELG